MYMANTVKVAAKSSMKRCIVTALDHFNWKSLTDSTHWQ